MQTESTQTVPSRFPPNQLANPDRRIQRLAVGSARLDSRTTGIPANHPAESGKPLAVRVAFASEIQIGLVADANEKVSRGRVRSVPGHRDRSVLMEELGVAGAFQLDRREFLFRRIGAGLDHFDFDFAVGLIGFRDRPMKSAAVIKMAIHVSQEIGDRGRRSGGIEFDFNIAFVRLDDDANWLGRVIGAGFFQARSK